MSYSEMSLIKSIWHDDVLLNSKVAIWESSRTDAKVAEEELASVEVLSLLDGEKT